MDEILNIFLDPLKIAGRSIILILTYTVLFLIIEAFVPKFKKWARYIIYYRACFNTWTNCHGCVLVNGRFSEYRSGFFFIDYANFHFTIIVVLNAVFSFIAWSPIVYFIFELLILLCKKVLIPGIVVALILDFCTRFFPEMSFSKASDLIRGTVMTLITASLLLGGIPIFFRSCIFYGR